MTDRTESEHKQNVLRATEPFQTRDGTIALPGLAIVLGGDGDPSRSIQRRRMHAKLLSGAWNSYVKHFGEHAVSAAEADLLGEALRLLQKVMYGCEGDFWLDDNAPDDLFVDISDLLAKTKGGE